MILSSLITTRCIKIMSLRPALWDFALSIYPHNKASLLRWQDAGAAINDLLLAGFAVKHQLHICRSDWLLVDSGRPRALLRRLRQHRFTLPDDHPTRPLALQWELSLEQWDLALLAACLDQRESSLAASQAVEVFCQHWQITKTQELHRLVQFLGR